MWTTQKFSGGIETFSIFPIKISRNIVKDENLYRHQKYNFMYYLGKKLS